MQALRRKVLLRHRQNEVDAEHVEQRGVVDDGCVASDDAVHQDLGRVDPVHRDVLEPGVHRVQPQERIVGHHVHARRRQVSAGICDRPRGKDTNAFRIVSMRARPRPRCRSDAPDADTTPAGCREPSSRESLVRRPGTAAAPAAPSAARRSGACEDGALRGRTVRRLPPTGGRKTPSDLERSILLTAPSMRRRRPASGSGRRRRRTR